MISNFIMQGVICMHKGNLFTLLFYIFNKQSQNESLISRGSRFYGNILASKIVWYHYFTVWQFTNTHHQFYSIHICIKNIIHPYDLRDFFFSFLFFYLVFLEKHGNNLETNMEFCWIFTFNRGSIVIHKHLYFEII